MRPRIFIIILPLLWWAFDVHAQVPEEQEFSSMPEQWQLTLDVIKSKAKTLMIENNDLQVEYRQLTGQAQELQQSMYEQQDKNDQVARFLKDRHGRTDQQSRIEALTQIIKKKEQAVRAAEEQLRNLNRKQSNLNNTIQQLKDTISNRGHHQQVDDLPQWHQQLEDESRQEVLLANELRDLKTGNKTQNLSEDVIEGQNKELEVRLGILQLQKLKHINKYSDVQLVEANAGRYDELKRRKDQLEAYINDYESRLDELRETSLMAMSWTLKRKKLVHAMVETDARNNKMRDTIKVLHEDIDVLKDQVVQLERRLNFVRSQAAQ